MARTKASVGAKVSSGKSSKARCSAAPPPASSSSGSREKSTSGGGGNSVCPRETPKWQRPITNFFICKDTDEHSGDEESAGSSKTKPKRNVIESDDETEEKAKNHALDETIDLEPLTGDSSHKIEEYYSKNHKGKGVGKKTKDKENLDCNSERRSSKRELEDSEDVESACKKVKV